MQRLDFIWKAGLWNRDRYELQGSWFLNPCLRDEPSFCLLLETSVGRCRFRGAIQCFCTSAAQLNAKNALGNPAVQVRVRGCEWQCLLLLPLDASLTMKMQFSIPAGAGTHTSEGRQLFLPFPPCPRCFTPQCSSEQCPRSLNSFSLNCRHCITHISACYSIPKHLPLFIWMV